MQGAFKLHNSMRAANEVFSREMLFTLANSGDKEQITTDNTIHFQKLWIYPGKGVNASTGVLTGNGGDIYVGKSGASVSFTPDSMSFLGTEVTVNKTAHGLVTGDSITVTGAAPTAYNVAVATVYDATADSFKYRVPTAPTTIPTTLPTIARTQYCPDKLASTDLPIKYELPLGQKMRLSQVIVSGTAGDGVFLQWS